jgi:hypothetical protein
MSQRAQAIAEYHQLLARDTGLSPRIFKKLRAAMRRDLLVYGDRPIGVALRPHLLEAAQFALLSRRAELIAAALEKIAAAAVEDPTLMHELGLTDTEQKLALVQPGRLCCRCQSMTLHPRREIRSRLHNARTVEPSDQEGLNRLLSELPEMSAFAQRHRLRQFSPVEKLLETLLETYREWGGSEVPGIAIVDWKDLPTSSEFVLLRDSFENHGVRTIICSPEDSYANGKLHCGDFVIDPIISESSFMSCSPAR